MTTKYWQSGIVHRWSVLPYCRHRKCQLWDFLMAWKKDFLFVLVQWHGVKLSNCCMANQIFGLFPFCSTAVHIQGRFTMFAWIIIQYSFYQLHPLLQTGSFAFSKSSHSFSLRICVWQGPKSCLKHPFSCRIKTKTTSIWYLYTLSCYEMLIRENMVIAIVHFLTLCKSQCHEIFENAVPCYHSSLASNN